MPGGLPGGGMGGFGIDRYINWFCRVSALDVRSCVEHSLVLPCVGSSLTLARVLGINLFCRVSGSNVLPCVGTNCALCIGSSLGVSSINWFSVCRFKRPNVCSCVEL